MIIMAKKLPTMKTANTKITEAVKHTIITSITIMIKGMITRVTTIKINNMLSMMINSKIMDQMSTMRTNNGMMNKIIKKHTMSRSNLSKKLNLMSNWKSKWNSWL